MSGTDSLSHDRPRSLAAREVGDGDAYIVFIGPCIAKKGEIGEEAVAGVIDSALTFRELREWMIEENIAIPEPEEGYNTVSRVNARLFPVEGGLVGTANMDTDILTSHIVVASGLNACEEVLNGIRTHKLDACLVELMACEGGCINGPVMEDLDGGTYLARQRVIDYAAHRQPKPLPARDEWPDLSRVYFDKAVPEPEFSEEQIRRCCTGSKSTRRMTN